MQKEIKRLRKKFFVLSTSVSFVVIFVMLFILNFLMHVSAQNELSTAVDMIIQAAYSNVPGIGQEKIFLNNAQRNADGNIPILRDPTTIESITLNGKMFCEDENELWYSGGGGIYFGLANKSGDIKFINKEYKFNRDNTKITVDFIDNSNFMLDGKKVETDIGFVSKDAFYISPVWWTASSKGLDPENVTLELYSIEIFYKKNIAVPYSENHQAVSRNFNEIFGTEVPHTLNNFSCFYYISDNQGNIIEINNGNLAKNISKDNIDRFIKDDEKSITLDGITYNHFSKSSSDYTVHTFVYNVQSEKNERTLLLISILSGGGVLILLTVLIYFVSGRAVKPISESLKKQKEFISNVSHELKTPITVISATTELMECKNGEDRHTRCIKVQSEKMSQLVNEMLMLTRLSESKIQESDFKIFNISQTIQSAVLYFESCAFEEQKEIQSDITDDISFNGMPEKIDNLIGILLDNAIKYSDEHSLIKINLFKEKDNVVLICENPCSDFCVDTKKLFERFYRADESHSGEKNGFGLGLSIAKEIVDLHKGNITADYKNGIITFKVVFSTKK